MGVLVRILQRKRTDGMYRSYRRFVIRNWLMGSSRLINPKVCRGPAAEPEDLLMEFPSESEGLTGKPAV